jgi:glyoxylase-like metal-dependent hydrolase (beta-lactamase superfamily II)
MRNHLSRRDLFKGFGAGALSAALGVHLTLDTSRAQAQETAPLTAVYQTTLGAFDVTVVRDGLASLGIGTLVANAEAEEVNELLAANGLPGGESVPNNFKIMIVNTGSDLVVFDTGLGPGSGVGGQLLPALERVGIAPGDVTTVVLSHWHPDHLGGAAVDGAPAFPSARYLISQTEFDLLQSDEQNGGFQTALGNLQPIMDADLLGFYNDGDTIVDGIEAVAAPGHTPGHHAFLISSDGAALLNTVDAIIHPVVSTQQTGWYFGFDADPEQAVETRRALLDRIASEDLLMFGYHFPFPGIGVVAAMDEENSYRFTPLSY